MPLFIEHSENTVGTYEKYCHTVGIFSEHKWDMACLVRRKACHALLGNFVINSLVDDEPRRSEILLQKKSTPAIARVEKLSEPLELLDYLEPLEPLEPLELFELFEHSLRRRPINSSSGLGSVEARTSKTDHDLSRSSRSSSAAVLRSCAGSICIVQTPTREACAS